MTMEIKLRDGERLDELHRKGYKLIQDPNRFCFGMDAVLLSDFALVKKNDDQRFMTIDKLVLLRYVKKK